LIVGEKGGIKDPDEKRVPNIQQGEVRLKANASKKPDQGVLRGGKRI